MWTIFDARKVVAAPCSVLRLEVGESRMQKARDVSSLSPLNDVKTENWIVKLRQEICKLLVVSVSRTKIQGHQAKYVPNLLKQVYHQHLQCRSAKLLTCACIYLRRVALV